MPEHVRCIEVFTGAGRRRSWSAGEKAAIVAASYGADETVCAVARRHGLTPQQLFAWRRFARRSALPPPPMFVPAVVGTSGPEAPPQAGRRAGRVSDLDPMSAK
jgi:transposase